MLVHFVEKHILELHLIDTWDALPSLTDNEKTKQREIYEEAVKKTRHCDTRLNIHRGMSFEIAKLFPDEYFDWVYIDADHEYVMVRRDLEIFCKKVKKGGVLAGHDFDDSPGVKKAVHEIVNEGFCKIICFTMDYCHSYALRVV